MLLSLLLTSSSLAGAYTVCPDGTCSFATLTEAATSAPDGASITVRAGAYHESLVISRDLSFIAEDEVFWAGTGDEPVLTVTPTGVVRLDGSFELNGEEVRPLVLVVGGVLRAEDISLHRGYSPGEGGAVSVRDGGTVELTRVSIRNIVTLGPGAALLTADSALTMVGGEIADVMTGSAAAVLDTHHSQSSLQDVDIGTFTSGTDAYGGAIHAYGGSLLLDDVVFSGGLAADGAIYAESVDFEAVNLSIVESYGWLGSGGLVLVEPTRVEISESTFTDNGAAGYYGGGSIQLAHIGDLEVHISSSVFRGNQAIQGGGISFQGDLDSAHLVLRDCIFEDNEADFMGGAVWMEGAGALSVHGSRFDGNEATDEGLGGAIALDTEDAFQSTIATSTFCANHASSRGGAVHVLSGGTHNVQNTVFSMNQAQEGGALWLDSSLTAGTLDISHSTFVGNTASRNGAAVLASRTTLEMAHNLLAYNNTSDAVVAASEAVSTIMAFDAWYENGASDTDILSRPTDFTLTRPPGFFSWDPHDPCSEDLRVGPESVVVDAGDPILFEADGSVSDVGVFSGPALLPEVLADEDLDGMPWRYDCNDGDASIYHGAFEACDGLDNDCNGETDDRRAWPDRDSDGYGSESAGSRLACTAPITWIHRGGDCNDRDPEVHPDAEEICNLTDDDCDGAIDDGIDFDDLYIDDDGDGWGGEPVTDCNSAEVHSRQPGDCDDSSALTHPDADEICGADLDCDGILDDPESVDTVLRLPDEDGDGYGVSGTAIPTCDEQWGVTAIDDCDDQDPTRSPGAPEVWYDGVDQDCDGASDFDRDGDGFDAWSYGGTDCDDRDATVVPQRGSPPCDVLQETTWAAGGGHCGCSAGAEGLRGWTSRLPLVALMRRR